MISHFEHQWLIQCLFSDEWEIWSTVLSEVIGELNLLIQVTSWNTRSDSCDSLEEVVCIYVWSLQQLRFNLHKIHINSHRIRRIRWFKETIMSLLELSGSLASSDGHHHSFLHDDCDIRTWITFGGFTQFFIILFCQIIRGLPYSDFKLDYSCVNIWKRNVYSLLKSSSNSRIQFPRNIACAKYQNTIIIITHTLHLHQELSLDSPRCFILSLASTSA